MRAPKLCRHCTHVLRSSSSGRKKLESSRRNTTTLISIYSRVWALGRRDGRDKISTRGNFPFPGAAGLGSKARASYEDISREPQQLIAYIPRLSTSPIRLGLWINWKKAAVSLAATVAGLSMNLYQQFQSLSCSVLARLFWEIYCWTREVVVLVLKFRFCLAVNRAWRWVSWPSRRNWIYHDINIQLAVVWELFSLFFPSLISTTAY
jgi:hypothetical protein